MNEHQSHLIAALVAGVIIGMLSGAYIMGTWWENQAISRGAGSLQVQGQGTLFKWKQDTTPDPTK